MRLKVRYSLAITVLAMGLSASAAKPLPDLKFKDLAGHAQGLSTLRGSITVLNFWATWCGPCREELPRLSALSQQYAGKGVHFVAVSVDEPKDLGKIAPYLASQHITLDAWTGASLDTLDRLHLGNVLPATLILDKDGVPIGRIEGEAKDADVKAYVDWLLGPRTTPAPPPLLKRY